MYKFNEVSNFEKKNSTHNDEKVIYNSEEYSKSVEIPLVQKKNTRRIIKHLWLVFSKKLDLEMCQR